MKSPQDMRIIQIDITNACMYQCSNCTRFCGHHKKPFFMDFETFQRAVDSLIGYHGTIGIMGGEPTLHPEFERFVHYLNDRLPKEYKKEHRALVAPQKDFIQSILLDNKRNSEVYSYTTGPRETVVGVGLWSAMVPTYKKHYELIQDVFKMQAVNDHGSMMYHSPILISRRDLDIPDEEWFQIRDNCWAQDVWSATITPKGAFFCEIAGALDMLFGGPGGWPIEEEWWKRTPDQFGDQLKWCEFCGIAIETYTRDANEWVDDVSESMYKKLEQIGSPKLKKPGRIHLVKIEHGKLAEQSKEGTKEVRKELFYDSFLSRFDRTKTMLFPDSFDVIVDLTTDREAEEVLKWLESHGQLFETIVLMVYGKSLWEQINTENKSQKVIALQADSIWGHAFASALSKCHAGNPIVYLTDLFYLNPEGFNDLKQTVINPGTLHVTDLKEHTSDLIVSNERNGILAMLHREALSLKKVGYDFLTNADFFRDIIRIWDETKIVTFTQDMIEDTSVFRIQGEKRYAVYGAGNTGRSALAQIRKMHSAAVLFTDSDPRKWGKEIDGIPVVPPKELYKRRDRFEQIIIASTYFKEIKDTIQRLGFGEQDYIIYE